MTYDIFHVMRLENILNRFCFVFTPSQLPPIHRKLRTELQKVGKFPVTTIFEWNISSKMYENRLNRSIISLPEHLNFPYIFVQTGVFVESRQVANISRNKQLFWVAIVTAVTQFAVLTLKPLPGETSLNALVFRLKLQFFGIIC